MSEQPKRYNLEQAQDEAAKMRAEIASGKAKNYIEAEKFLY